MCGDHCHHTFITLYSKHTSAISVPMIPMFDHLVDYVVVMSSIVFPIGYQWHMVIAGNLLAYGGLVVVLVVPPMLLHHLCVLVDEILDVVLVHEPDRQAAQTQ